MNTKFRQATVKDIDNIYKIELETYNVYAWSKDIFRNELENQYSRYFVVENNKNEIIGYIGCWLIKDEGHITTLVVLSKYRRRHIADTLLYNLIQFLQIENINWLTLEVRVSNIQAINLYKKFGFKELGIRKKYYQDNNEDALLLWSENINTLDYKRRLVGIGDILISVCADKYRYS